MELHLKIIGWVLVLLSFSHIAFPWYFSWKTDFGKVSLINRQMFKVHVFFIALFVLLTGLMNLNLSEDLITTHLGRWICLGLGFFWGLRSIIQFFGYSSKIWKGKFFETTMHVFFSLFWIYMTVVYFKIGLA